MGDWASVSWTSWCICRECRWSDFKRSSGMLLYPVGAVLVVVVVVLVVALGVV